MTSTLGKLLTTRKCSRCGKVKSVKEFYKHGIRYRKQRYRPQCIKCYKIIIDRERKRSIQRKHYKAHKRYYFDRNLERKKRFRKATPVWANITKIRKIYAKMRKLNKNLEIKLYEVDHIIPIKSKKVCGLHVSYNLQIVTSKYNKYKGNALNPILYPEQG